MEDIKVGDIVGNTVVGFVWKVLKIEGDKLLIKNTKTNKEKKVYSDGYYKSKSDSNKKIGEGSEIQFKHLLSMKTLKGTIDGEYDHNYWVVDSGKDGMFMVPKNDKSIKDLTESLINSLIRSVLKENNYRVTSGSEEIHQLNDEPIKFFANKYKDKSVDIFFLKDNKASISKRTSNLIYHGKDSGKSLKNQDNIKYVYSGLEDSFYTLENWKKLISSVYKGTNSKIKKINNLQENY